MELTTEQNAKFKELCKEIKPGEYGRVVVSFTGGHENFVQITGEKQFRFHKENPLPTYSNPQNRRGSGRYED